MNKVQVRDLVFHEGRPKICVPIVGKTEEEILQEAEFLKDVDFDVIEWRVDHYEDVAYFSKVEKILQKINQLQKPLLFTFRSRQEGGMRDMTQKQYVTLNEAAIQSRWIDLIDIELFHSQDEIKNIVKVAKKNNVKVIMSNHDFDKTPSKEEILKRLLEMQNLGADITKIAVMPQNEEDVLTLLEATLAMKQNKGNQPCITVSMGPLGIASRLTGELFGSCMTFGAARQPSAPGQIAVKDLHRMLDLLKL